MINNFLKNKISRIADLNCQKKANRYFDNHFVMFSINESYNNLVHLENFKTKFSKVPNNEELLEAIEQAKYLTQISEMGVHNIIETLSNISSTLKGDINFKIIVENLKKNYHSNNKFNTFKYITEVISSNPYYLQNDTLKSVRNNMYQFYRLNEENILLYNIISTPITNQFDNYSINEIKDDILSYITERNIPRQDLILTLKQYKGSSIVENLINTLEYFGKNKLVFGANGNATVKDVYSFTNEINENEFVFGTNNKLYRADILNEKFTEIVGENNINENYAILEMNNVADRYFNSETGCFNFNIGGKILEMHHAPALKKNIVKYNNEIINEEFGQFLNRLMHVYNIPESNIIWKIYENLNLHRHIEFATNIKSIDESKSATIFNYNNIFGVELNDKVNNYSLFKNNLTATSLKNSIFEHLNCDITNSLNKFLTKERSILRTLERQKQILESEIKPIQESINKITTQLDNKQISHEFIEKTISLREELQIQLDYKKQNISSINQKILEFDTQLENTVCDDEECFYESTDLVVGDKINYNGNLMIVASTDDVSKIITCTDVNGKQVFINYSESGNYVKLTKETEVDANMEQDILPSSSDINENIGNISLHSVLQNTNTGEEVVVTGTNTTSGEKIVSVAKLNQDIGIDDGNGNFDLNQNEVENEWIEVAGRGARATTDEPIQTDPANLHPKLIDTNGMGSEGVVQEGIIGTINKITQSIFNIDYKKKTYVVHLSWKGEAKYSNITELIVYYNDKEVYDDDIIDGIYDELQFNKELWNTTINENTELFDSGFERLAGGQVDVFTDNKSGNTSLKIKPADKLAYTDVSIDETKYSIPNQRVIRLIQENFGEHIKLGRNYQYSFNCYNQEKKVKLLEELEPYTVVIELDLFPELIDTKAESISDYVVRDLNDVKELCDKLGIRYEIQDDYISCNLPNKAITWKKSIWENKAIREGDRLIVDWKNNKIISINDNVLLESYTYKFKDRISNIREEAAKEKTKEKADDKEVKEEPNLEKKTKEDAPIDNEVKSEKDTEEVIEDTNVDTDVNVDIELNTRVFLTKSEMNGTVISVDTDNNEIGVQTDDGELINFELNSEGKEWKRIDEFGNVFENTDNTVFSLPLEIADRYCRLNNVACGKLKAIEQPDKISNYLFMTRNNLSAPKMASFGFLDVKNDQVEYEGKYFTVARFICEELYYILILDNSNGRIIGTFREN